METLVEEPRPEPGTRGNFGREERPRKMGGRSSSVVDELLPSILLFNQAAIVRSVHFAVGSYRGAILRQRALRPYPGLLPSYGLLPARGAQQPRLGWPNPGPGAAALICSEFCQEGILKRHP